jgi:Holliday junction DNA helicase RuvB
VRDFAVVKGDGTITAGIAKNALSLMQIDELGLDELDRRILSVIAEDFNELADVIWRSVTMD